MERNCHPKLIRNPHRIWKSLFLIFSITTSVCSAPQKSARPPVQVLAASSEISIIPQPVSIKPANGFFEFTRDTKIIAVDPNAVKAAASLNNLLMERYKFTLEVTPDTSSQNSITFSKANVDSGNSGSGEAYSLLIKPDAIQIKGSERGMFYGIQSLLQLFPGDFIGDAKIPAAEISDAPRFGYRGMHLDVARHFMPVWFVKKFIRLISRYKYNHFHWHLTDDQGWRIEIKKYPLLTTVGSERPETQVGRSRPYIGDKIPVKGFYTQEEIREIVAYAKERYVTIIPEIELPGHSTAALASYPKLGCKKFPYKVQTSWGAFPYIYCPTDYTFQFLDDVFTEVIGLFHNSPYIHIGGDEVMTDFWSDSKFVQDLKRTNGLRSEGEVQSWFIKRVESIINSKGKKIIGWDDMLDTGDAGLPPKATVMFWRSTSMARQSSELARRNPDLTGRQWGTAVKAARLKHDVIMTPDDYTYFDHPQGDWKREPESIYRSPTTLDQVYDFEPLPPGLSQEEAKYIIGGQGCLWSEFLKEPKDVEYMMFPRALALAEVLWSKQGKKDFAAFSKRVNKELPNLDQEPVNYRKPRR